MYQERDKGEGNSLRHAGQVTATGKSTLRGGRKRGSDVVLTRRSTGEREGYHQRYGDPQPDGCESCFCVGPPRINEKKRKNGVVLTQKKTINIVVVFYSTTKCRA